MGDVEVRKWRVPRLAGWKVKRDEDARRLVRVMALMLLLGVLVGPVATLLGEGIDEGDAPLGVFGMLLFFVGLVLGPLGQVAEEIVLRPGLRVWLGGRLRRWQRLILPFGTERVIVRGVNAGMIGATVLLVSEQGWSIVNAAALAFVAGGGVLLGFGLSRLLVGLLIVHRSGNWRARPGDWKIGGLVVAVAAVANGIYLTAAVLRLAPGL